MTAAVPSVLAAGTALLSVTQPASAANQYQVGLATFGPELATPGVTGEVMPVVDSSSSGSACGPLSAANTLAVNGKLALIDRGVCVITLKVKNAQDAGAIGVIIAENVAGSPPIGISGVDPTITIPSVRISLSDGNALKSALRFRSRTHSGVFATLGIDANVRLGADAAGRALMYTPDPFHQGSSVSHWDTLAFPNQLMEPAINPDLTHEVIPPNDLTFLLLQDEGW